VAVRVDLDWARRPIPSGMIVPVKRSSASGIIRSSHAFAEEFPNRTASEASLQVAPLPWAHIALTGDYLWNEIDRPL
jgi:hypothetical protein